MPWGIFWQRKGYWWRISVILLIISIPPIGLFGWANPITAAGSLFPGTKWFGLQAIVLVLILACYASQGQKISIYSLIILGGFSVISQIIYQEPPKDRSILAINIELGWIQSLNDEYEHNKILIEIISEVISNHNAIKLILLPELVVGNWNNANKHLWEKLHTKCKELGITIFLGGKIDITPREYISGLITIGKEEGVMLLDRVPVPISMWRPWITSKKTAISYWFNPGIYNIAGKKIAAVICYEQLLIWPILYSMIYKPELLLASSNVWWARNTNIPSIQQQVVKTWGKLFYVPVFIAVNR